MAGSLQAYEQMSEQAAGQITRSHVRWTEFLTTAARLYKYPYHEQLMIFAQRPDATACAEYQVWNQRMQRYVRRGAKGIALIDATGDTPRLRYVFDVSDTGGREHSHRPFLWEMRQEHGDAVSYLLSREYGTSATQGLSSQIEQVARNLADSYWAEHRSDILGSIDGSFLEEYDAFNIRVSFQRAVTASSAYAIMSRCGLDPGAEMRHEDFMDVFDWNVPDAVAALGTAVSQINEQVLRQIEVVVKNHERDKTAERGEKNERNRLHAERGLPDTGRHDHAAVPPDQQIREDAEGVSQETPSNLIQFPGIVREALPPPAGDRGRGEPAYGADDAGDGESRRDHGAVESGGSDGLGGRDEQHQSPRGGSDPPGADLQLSLFADEADLIRSIEKAESIPPTPAALSFTNADIEAELRRGSGVAGGKLRIYALYQQLAEPKDIQAFLKKEYGTSGHSHTFVDGSHGFVDYRLSEGMTLQRHGANDLVVKWPALEKHLRTLIASGDYLTEAEKQEYAELEQTYAGFPGGIPAPLARLGFQEAEPVGESIAESPALETPPAPLEEAQPESFGLKNRAAYVLGYRYANDRLLVFNEANDDPDVIPPIVARIEPDGSIVFLDENLPEKERLQIHRVAETELEGYKAQAEADLQRMIDAAARINESFEAPQPEPETPKPQNFRITDMRLGEGGAKTKYANNVAAIRTLQTIESEGRQATQEEQEVLSRYIGWGGISQAFDVNHSGWAREYAELKDLLTESEYQSARASTLNAHYTNPAVIQAIYAAVENMGFTSGNILEPACGVGNFFGMLPESMESARLYGVELDSITGRIAKLLYPQAGITVAGFEKTDRRDFFDLAIGNVPFGDYKVSDKAYDKLNYRIHDYFFAKALDQVRPGGIVAFITSKGTMDKRSPDVRRYLAQRAELLGAVRLPNDAFKANAGTVVTSDIIFLQKRERPIDIVPDWVHLGQTEDGIPVNSYFAERPEMVLGRMVRDDGMYGKQSETACHPIEGAVLAEQLTEAISHIRGRITEIELPDLGEGEPDDASIPADPNVRNYSYTVVDDEVYYRENSIMVRPKLNQAAQERVKALVALRDCVHSLINQQLDASVSDETIRGTQAEMNRLYDAFTAKHGLINSRASALAFDADSAYFLLCSLEILDEQGQMERKADMFTKRTIMQPRAVTSVDTASEALAVSISERACVDMDFMQSLTGFSEEKIAHDLRGVIFRDLGHLHPDDAQAADYTLDDRPYVTADAYLSGNVRNKLRLASALADKRPDLADQLAPNIAALEQAQPVDLDASEIDVRLGATWIDKSYIQDFMYELLNPPNYLRDSIQVNYSQHTADWNITGKRIVSYNNVAAYATYGTERASAYSILEESLNLRDVRIYDRVFEEGKEKRVLNSKDTMLAQQKQQAIKDAFRDWIWKDPDRRHALVRQYNEQFNSMRLREYDGSHISFTGMNPEISLRPHQHDAIAHVLYGGNTLLAHEVGAGKTFEMVAAAMESKRLGLSQKALFAVPNHLTEQWASEFLRLYPSANILVTTKKDFEKRSRKKFCARIATGDYDAIIMGHSQFERIPVSIERQERLLDEQIREIEEGIEELENSGAERFTVKQLERTKKGLEAKLEKLHDSDRKDDVVTFEQLGVDRLYVDEAHGYKNLFLFTKMRNVAGLSTSEAQKSSDMLLKCRYIDEITGNKGIVFATGTPVSNSMTELFTMMRYLQHDTLRQKNLTHFDCWASTFGETATTIELAPEGTGYRARTRFAKFFNLPELMTLFKEVADIKTADQLNLPTPEPVYHTVIAQPTDLQKQMVQELSERAAEVHTGRIDPSRDNMLKITSDGRKLGLDQRIINPMLPDDPDSKVNLCVRNIAQIWRDGQEDKLTQLVFCDISTPKDDGSFSIYGDIRAKLVAQGIPMEQVAFIHDANTEAKKKELFAKVRSGQVRVLMGSTAKMGAGTNIQDRLVALHDLDCPWRPGDLEQRSGRIIRQGNRNEKVHIFRYATECTFDSYIWQTVENKQKFISQIMTSKSPVRSCEDIDETALSYAEIKALCAGNPQIKEKMDLDVEVSKLRLLKASHQAEQYRMEDSLRKYFPEQIMFTKGSIAGLEADMATVKANTSAQGEFYGMEVLGKHYMEKEAAGNALLDACKAFHGDALNPVTIGNYRGFTMSLSIENLGRDFVLTLKGQMTHKATLGADARGNVTRIDNKLADIPGRIRTGREQLDNLLQQMESAKQEVGKPFPQEAALAEKSARLAALDALLNMDANRKTQENEPEEDAPPAKRPSVLEALKVPVQRKSDDREGAPAAKRSREAR